jgi:glycosyltransferase involved in cell wall biosynthesis
MISPVTEAQITTNKEDNCPGVLNLESPLVSIVIPNYNHAKYLSEAIQSVLGQTYRNFEIIVIDDGSTDNSREVVIQFGNQIRYIWQENRGLSAARNTGIHVAKGEFIGVLDADDMYEPDFLNTLVAILQANPDADAVYCGFQFVDMTNNLLPQVGVWEIPSDHFYDKLVDGNFLVPPCMLIRRHCYQDVGSFDESLRACEDWDMWLRIGGRYNVIGTAKILIRYRILPGSMSSDPIRMLNNRLAVIDKHFGTGSSNLTFANTLPQRTRSWAYLTTTLEYLQYHDLDQAYRCLLTAFTINPDMVSEFRVFYELGCGDQPKGFRGNFATLNVQHNARVLIEILNKLFDDPQAPVGLRHRWRVAYANAFLALGLLSYGTRQFQQARHFLLRAMVTYPPYSVNRRLIVTLAKSLLRIRLGFVKK